MRPALDYLTCEDKIHIVGTISGEEPAELTMQAAFTLEGTTRLLIDGQATAYCMPPTRDTSINIEEKLQLMRGGTLQVTQGEQYRCDLTGTRFAPRRLFNLGGVLHPWPRNCRCGLHPKRASPAAERRNRVRSGTLVLQPNQTPDFAQQIQLGGTILIDFSGRTADPGSTYELLRFNGGSVKNTGIQCTGLPTNTFLRVRRETDSRTAAEVLMGEVTSVDEVFGLNEGNESSIARPPTDAKLGDVNDDGLLDLAFTLPGATELDNGNFVVLLNEGDGNGDAPSGMGSKPQRASPSSSDSNRWPLILVITCR